MATTQETMSEMASEEGNNTKITDTTTGIHLCVLIHGLWGNPKHLDQVASALRKAYPDEFLQLLVAKRNAGNSTYDGVELGGERVTREIEDEIEELEKDGRKVTKLSMVGYSLGGLVARYAVGLLYSAGLFDKIQPMNFTTFASPHLGVRTPSVGWHFELWNRFGGSTLSASGQQLFTIDTFRDTGKCLLSVMSDPSSVFMKGLGAFKHRSLYANIVNDRAVPFYTAYISRTDPFIDLSVIDINYIPDYEDVILDSKKLVTRKTQQLTLYESVTAGAANFYTKAPLFLFIGLVAPIGSIAYLVNSGIQSYRSAARIKLHEEGKAGISVGTYRLPSMVEDAKQRADKTFLDMNARQGEEFIEDADDQRRRSDKDNTSEDDESDMETTPTGSTSEPSSSLTKTMSREDEERKSQPTQKSTQPETSEFPTLALTKEQLTMIDNLDNIGFDKYAVHIHKAPHSHAAIIVRMARASFGEGRIVSKHWTERFEL